MRSTEFFDKAMFDKTVEFYDAKDLGYTGMQSDSPLIRTIFFDSEMYKGKPTKVFAYLGIPDHKDGEKLPAVVLVPGGNNAAYECWVRQWVEKGYVAITMDLSGRYPSNAAKFEGDIKECKSHEFAGPFHDGYDVISPKEDAWMYHAVCGVIYAHNIVRSLSCVDIEKVGIIGNSWGGVITCTAIGVDNRFNFAVPVYGCGYLFEERTSKYKLMTMDKKEWDPSEFLKETTVPTFWINGDRDGNFDISVFTKSARVVRGESMMAIKPNYRHSHQRMWDDAPELYSYVDWKVKGGAPLITFEEIEVSEGKAKVKVNIPLGRELKEIKLVSHSSDDIAYYDAPEPSISSVDGELTDDEFSAVVPDDAKRFYIYARDNDCNTTSTFLYEIEA